VAWLASRLRMTCVEALVGEQAPWSGYHAALRHGKRRIEVGLRPVQSDAPPGTTLSVRLVAARRRERLTVDVTAEAAGVTVRANLDGRDQAERRFLAPRRRESDLLAETIEGGATDRISTAALEMAAALVEGRG